MDQLNAVASAAYSALQAQASKTDSTARGLKQSSGGFVPVADLQAVFAAISRVSGACISQVMVESMQGKTSQTMPCGV